MDIREYLTWDECKELKRLSKRMRGWNERLCNDTEYDEEKKCYMRRKEYRAWGIWNYSLEWTPDLGTGTLKRANALIERVNERKGVALAIYEQSDCRGACFYVYDSNVYSKKGIDCCYSSVAYCCESFE